MTYWETIRRITPNHRRYEPCAACFASTDTPLWALRIWHAEYLEMITIGHAAYLRAAIEEARR